MTDSSLLSVVRAFAGDALRDCWLVDRERDACLYMREDVRERVSEFDPDPYIDNERYGFITRNVYEQLSYATFQYTVRGFDEFEQFRAFLGSGPVGVIVSVDRAASPHDFAALYERLAAAVDDRSYDDLLAEYGETVY